MTTSLPDGSVDWPTPVGRHLLTVPAQVFPLSSLPAGGLVVGGDVLLLGLRVRETSGAAPGAVDLFDGGQGNGFNVGSYGMVANGSAGDWFGPQGIGLRTGLFVVITGLVAGAVFYIDLLRQRPDPS